MTPEALEAVRARVEAGEAVEARELDALVALRLFGHELKIMGARQDPECGVWGACLDCEFGVPDWASMGLDPAKCPPPHRHHAELPFIQHGDGWSPLPEYSTDMAEAWTVVEHITGINQPFAKNGFPPGTKFGFWFQSANLWAYSAAEAAEAICRAALQALAELDRVNHQRAMEVKG